MCHINLILLYEHGTENTSSLLHLLIKNTLFALKIFNRKPTILSQLSSKKALYLLRILLRTPSVLHFIKLALSFFVIFNLKRLNLLGFTKNTPFESSCGRKPKADRKHISALQNHFLVVSESYKLLYFLNVLVIIFTNCMHIYITWNAFRTQFCYGT